MSEEQLERSILERKASEELRAIATAMSLEPVARTRKADLVNQILRAAGVEVEDAPGAHAGASAASEATTANGADAGSAAQAGEASSKPTRGRTSRARSATKTDVSEPVEAGSNGSAGESGPGRSGDGPHSYDSAVVNGNSPAGSPGAEVENAVAEAAAAILASSDSERISRDGDLGQLGRTRRRPERCRQQRRVRPDPGRHLCQLPVPAPAPAALTARAQPPGRPGWSGRPGRARQPPRTPAPRPRPRAWGPRAPRRRPGSGLAG